MLFVNKCEHKIILNNDKVFTAKTDESIFNAALRAGLTLNHSCLNGRCNSCMAVVESGQSEVLQDELGLSTEESKTGNILTCSRVAVSDLNLFVEEYIDKVLPSRRTLPAKVRSFRLVKEDVLELVLRLPPNQKFHFESGQYVNLIRGDIKRSYSIANSTSSNTLSFFIKNYPSGQMSKYLFSDLEVDDLFRIEGPIGTFFYRNTPKKTLIFLATGTGIAPVKSILEGLALQPDLVIDKQIHVFWGNRSAGDFFWQVAFQNLDVNFHPCISRPENYSEGFKKGYVQEVLLNENVDIEDSIVYACGSEAMIQSARTLLTEHGLEIKNFYSDAFVVSN